MDDAFKERQELFAKSGTRYYGDGGTVHGSTEVNVELHNGVVVAVWFRCSALRFTANNCGPDRAKEMKRMYAEASLPELHGLELKDAPKETK